MTRGAAALSLVVTLCGGCTAPIEPQAPTGLDTTSTDYVAETTNQDTPRTGELDAEAEVVQPSPTGDVTDVVDVTASVQDISEAGPWSSPCTIAVDAVSCPYQTRKLKLGAPHLPREVHHQVPLGQPPPEGFPAVLLFQGSYASAEWTWNATALSPFGLLEMARCVSDFLSAGYVIIAPEAKLQGSTFWDTNVPVWKDNWTASADHALMLKLFEGIEAGDYGPVNPKRLYAMGLSSGGYMTSRMALSYPGVFRALMVHSASWATCLGTTCVVPGTLPLDHPPTLFIHGQLDAIVPVKTMLTYHQALKVAGHSTQAVVVSGAGHAWLAEASEETRAFFAMW